LAQQQAQAAKSMMLKLAEPTKQGCGKVEQNLSFAPNLNVVVQGDVKHPQQLSQELIPHRQRLGIMGSRWFGGMYTMHRIFEARWQAVLNGQRLDHMCRVVMDGAQQSLGRTCRVSAALLPVTQGGELYVDHRGELGLRQSSGLAYRFDPHGIDSEFTRRLAFTTDDLVHLFDAFQQATKEFLFHYIHLSLSLRSAAFSASLRESLIPFL
jgi:hypothetical protein